MNTTFHITNSSFREITFKIKIVKFSTCEFIMIYGNILYIFIHKFTPSPLRFETAMITFLLLAGARSRIKLPFLIIRSMSWNISRRWSYKNFLKGQTPSDKRNLQAMRALTDIFLLLIYFIFRLFITSWFRVLSSFVYVSVLDFAVIEENSLYAVPSQLVL